MRRVQRSVCGTFNIRFKEHSSQSKNRNADRSHIAQHCITSNYLMESDNFKILHRENKGSRLNNLEAYGINKNIHLGKTLLNDPLDLNSTLPSPEIRTAPLVNPPPTMHKYMFKFDSDMIDVCLAI
jgi:hypothetical protein